MFFPRKTNCTTSLSPTQGISVFRILNDRRPTQVGSRICWAFCATRIQSDECVGLCGTTGGVGGSLERSLCCVINPNYISKQINPIRCCGGGSAPANQSTLGIIHGREVVVVVVGLGVEGRVGRVVHFSVEMLSRSTKTPPSQPALRTRPVLFRPPLTVRRPVGRL